MGLGKFSFSLLIGVGRMSRRLPSGRGVVQIDSPSVPGRPYNSAMQLTIQIPDETAALLQSRGVEIAAFAAEAVAREAQAVESRTSPEIVAAAVDRILERRSRLALDGLKIRDLIDEGRKY